MSKKSTRHESDSTLPEEAQILIARKLRQQRREQEKLLVGAKQAAYSKLRKDLLANIQARRLGQTLISVPLEVYGEIVASVTNATIQWPGIVWRTIKSILEKAQVRLRDSREINAIVDEFSWAVEQNPFTLDWVEAERFRESVHREVKRYGVFRDEFMAAFNQQLEHAAALAQCGILNTARQAREGIGIAIDEHLIAKRITTSPTAGNHYTPSNARREARKLDTQAMYEQWRKEYRMLKKNRPNMTDVWYSQQIARLEIARGRDAETIRKQITK